MMMALRSGKLFAGQLPAGMLFGRRFIGPVIAKLRFGFSRRGMTFTRHKR